MDEQKYEQIYNAMLEFENRQHEKNQRRIKAGLVCLLVIPIAFLVLMFLTSSSKPVFLVLWIISLYGIAVYLIGVEYADHRLQKQLAAFRGEEDAEAKPLIGQGIEAVEDTLRSARSQALQILGKEDRDTSEEKEQDVEILDLNEISDEIDTKQ